MARWNALLSEHDTEHSMQALNVWLVECKKFRKVQVDDWRAACEQYLKALLTHKGSILLNTLKSDSVIETESPTYTEHPIEKTDFYDFIHAKFVTDFGIVNKEDIDFVDKVFILVKAIRYSHYTSAIFDEMYEEDEHLVGTAAAMSVLHVFCC